MKTISEKTVSALNDLIEICCDGAEGFGKAAKEVDRPELRDLFSQLSTQRRGFAEELRACVREFGEKPEDSGSMAAAAHRGWMNLREALSTKDNHTILAECERGEDHAIAAYRKASAEVIDTAAAAIVSRQQAEVQKSHDRVRDLRDSPAYRKD